MNAELSSLHAELDDIKTKQANERINLTKMSVSKEIIPNNNKNNANIEKFPFLEELRCALILKKVPYATIENV